MGAFTPLLASLAMFFHTPRLRQCRAAAFTAFLPPSPLSPSAAPGEANEGRGKRIQPVTTVCLWSLTQLPTAPSSPRTLSSRTLLSRNAQPPAAAPFWRLLPRIGAMRSCRHPLMMLAAVVAVLAYAAPSSAGMLPRSLSLFLLRSLLSSPLLRLARRPACSPPALLFVALPPMGFHCTLAGAEERRTVARFAQDGMSPSFLFVFPCVPLCLHVPAPFSPSLPHAPCGRHVLRYGCMGSNSCEEGAEEEREGEEGESGGGGSSALHVPQLPPPTSLSLSLFLLRPFPHRRLNAALCCSTRLLPCY